MSKESPTVAVTALNATDNPGPGVAVIRALRAENEFRGRIVGLAYDSLEPGIYASDLVDDVFLIPYPSEGSETLEQRIREIHAKVPLDAIIPTLDSELISFMDIQPALDGLGIATFLPTREQFDLRSKAHLVSLGERSGISVPSSRVLTDVNDLYDLGDGLEYPVVIKGIYYGAKVAHGVEDAVHAFHDVVAKWGFPVIAQQFVKGDEYDIVAVGDGKGGLVGAVPMRKTYLTEKGKGWAGITVKDPNLIDLTRRFMETTRWRGPCEVEIIKDTKDAYHLMEINPRFPAWVYLSAGAGMNLPYATVRLALGQPVPSLSGYRVGTMFVRISLDQIANLEDFQKISTQGEILGRRKEGP